MSKFSNDNHISICFNHKSTQYSIINPYYPNKTWMDALLQRQFCGDFMCIIMATFKFALYVPLNATLNKYQISLFWRIPR